jgi:secondary thiamine-phosphate synthase enzyme
MIRRIQVKTRGRDDWVDLTAAVRDAVRASGIDEGVVTVFVPHTTAGITIQENADPPLKDDIMNALDRLFPWRGGYGHCEDNAASHMKTCLMGNSAQVVFDGGELILGTWQEIFLCEFDGPRTRDVVIKVSP